MFNNYLVVHSVEECLNELHKHRGRARIIAGGTDLILQLKKKKYDPDFLFDITNISALKEISKDNGVIHLGAGVTHAEVVSSPEIKEAAPLLIDACASIGSPQIRNIATVAGNVVNAQPAADAAVALIALGAEAEIVTMRGVRTELVENLYAGVGQSIIDSSSELVKSIKFRGLHENQGAAFLRIAPREALALPVLNTATVITVEQNIVQDLRIVLGPVAQKPLRPLAAEIFIKDKKITPAIISDTAAIACQESMPRDSLIRGSANYRKELIKVLVERALNKAISEVQ